MSSASSSLLIVVAILASREATAQQNDLKRTVLTAVEDCLPEITGAKPNDTVTVHYTGTLKSNGAQLDSSVGGQPISFKLGAGNVIRGLDRGLAGTCEGERIRLEIPFRLGYGAKGAGEAIPPNADLVFELTLVELKRDLHAETLIAKSCTKDRRTRDRDIVEFHHVARLTNGTIFSDNRDGQPITIEIGNTGIKGFDIALLQMCPGELKRALIPPHLAYGEKGIPGSVPPNAVVVVDLELLNVQDRVLSFLQRSSDGRFRGRK